MSSAAKIKAVQIELQHSTGPSDVGEGLKHGVIAGTTATVTTFAEASDQMKRWQDINPVGRSELVDWTVTFENGERMQGTYQIIRPNDRPAEEPDFIAAMTSGLIRLTGDSPEDLKFQKLVDKDGRKRIEAQAILDTYDFELDEEPSATAAPGI